MKTQPQPLVCNVVGLDEGRGIIMKPGFVRRPKRLPSLPTRPPSSVISFTIYPQDKRRLRVPDKRRSGLLSQSLVLLPATLPGSPARPSDNATPAILINEKQLVGGLSKQVITRIRSRRTLQPKPWRSSVDGSTNNLTLPRRDFDITPWAVDTPSPTMAQ